MAPSPAGVVAYLACVLVLAASDNPPPKQLSTASLAVDGTFPTMTTTAVIADCGVTAVFFHWL